eukprot:TRINITY_DN80525_c0_g1_i1.p1 TRINITY_DN80525_c0_g1~~TRINITY_DN80525_c0_g1_i1.p1  ORF type:complete len:415 (-),score=70.55 TRINITY_DN80525_c0_g1_i1:284-1528(-)
MIAAVPVVGVAAAVGVSAACLRSRATPKRCFPKPSGPHAKLVASHEEIELKDPETGCTRRLRCQLIAPADGHEDSRTSTHGTYYRSEAIDALLGAMKPNTSEWGWGKAALAQAGVGTIKGSLKMLLAGQSHPDPSPGTSENAGAKRPLVIFSHGLFGNSLMYTQLCRELASYGCVVVALEHQDGTATGTLELPYKRPPAHVTYNVRDTVQKFRQPMLEQRQKETAAFLRYVQQTSKDDLPQILRQADATQVVFAGHSFGAAGTLHAVNTDSTLRSVAKLLLLYDTWAWPLDSEKNVAGLPALCVLSEEFRKGRELPPIANTLKGQGSVLWLPGAGHQLWSDFVWLFPSRVNAPAKFKDPQNSHKAWVAATFGALDQALQREAPTSRPEHPEESICNLELPLPDHISLTELGIVP